MDDDFNTGGAIGALYGVLTILNRLVDKCRLEDSNPNEDDKAAFFLGTQVLRELGQILGLFGESAKHSDRANDGLINGLMQLLIDLRAEARKSKNFAMADQIRKRLTDLGVTIEDRPGGTGWRLG
jgi:cysteinyl-tRNA synthetase